MREATKPKMILLAASGFLLSVLTVFLGTPFLRVLRKSYGPVVYWSLGLIFSALAFQLWFLIASLWILIGVYHEAEKLKKGWWLAGILSVALSFSFGWFSAARFLDAKGIQSREQIVEMIGEFTANVEALAPSFKVKAEDIYNQIPSLLIMTLMLTLANAVIFERRVLDWLALPIPEDSSQESKKLLELRVPDYFIWVALVALLFSAVSFGSKAVEVFALNVVNVSTVIYFFQGLAVLETYLRLLKAGFLMRFVTYFIIVGQLFLLVSIVGLIDFWADFRTRMLKLNSQSEGR